MSSMDDRIRFGFPCAKFTDESNITIKTVYNSNESRSFYTYFASGVLRSENHYEFRQGKYCKDWILHKESGPAFVLYSTSKNQKIKEEEYWIKGGKHRGNGEPAVILYYPNKKRESASWIENDRPHRINAPAYINYDKDGREWTGYFNSGYYIKGNNIKKELAEWLLENKMPLDQELTPNQLIRRKLEIGI